MVICLEQGANDSHMIQLENATATVSSLASLKSRMVSPSWCWLTQAVLEKRPLNGCLSVLMNSRNNLLLIFFNT